MWASTGSRQWADSSGEKAASIHAPSPAAVACASVGGSGAGRVPGEGLPVRHAHDKLEAGPDRIDGADFDVNVAHGERDGADDVFGDIGGDTRGALWPRDPHGDLGSEGGAQGGEGLVEVGGLRDEGVGEVYGAIWGVVEGDRAGERCHDVGVRPRRAKDKEAHAGGDAKLAPERRP